MGRKRAPWRHFVCFACEVGWHASAWTSSCWLCKRPGRFSSDSLRVAILHYEPRSAANASQSFS